MHTPGRRRKALTARLRAMMRRSDATTDDAPHSRIHTIRFEHTHRVPAPPDPPRRWYEAQGIEPMDGPRRWK